jgi:hypothetical protein
MRQSFDNPDRDIIAPRSIFRFFASVWDFINTTARAVQSFLRNLFSPCFPNVVG